MLEKKCIRNFIRFEEERCSILPGCFLHCLAIQIEKQNLNEKNKKKYLKNKKLTKDKKLLKTS